jgi:deoxyribodipyrimidine photo-lyase
VHAWSLGDPPPAGVPAPVWLAGFHRRWPWSERRWRFVGDRMKELTSLRWVGSARAIGEALASARSVRGVAEPHLAPWLERWADPVEPSDLFPAVARRCDSFSQWWTRAMRGVHAVDDLLGEAPHNLELFA